MLVTSFIAATAVTALAVHYLVLVDVERLNPNIHRAILAYSVALGMANALLAAAGWLMYPALANAAGAVTVAAGSAYGRRMVRRLAARTAKAGLDASGAA